LEDPPGGASSLRPQPFPPTEDMHRRLTEVSEMAETHLRRASEAEEEVRFRKQQQRLLQPPGLRMGSFFTPKKIW